MGQNFDDYPGLQKQTFYTILQNHCIYDYLIPHYTRVMYIKEELARILQNWQDFKSSSRKLLKWAKSALLAVKNKCCTMISLTIVVIGIKSFICSSTNPFTLNSCWQSQLLFWSEICKEFIYRTRAIISRGLYFFYPIFTSAAAYITDNLCTKNGNSSFFKHKIRGL